MDEQKVREIVSDMLRTSQFNPGAMQYHQHNGIDSAQIYFPNLINPLNHFIAAATTSGTAPVYFFSPSGIPITISITGMFINSLDSTGGLIQLYNGNYQIQSISKGTTSGAMLGTLVAIPSFGTVSTVLGGTPIYVKSSGSGNATVFITFTI